MSKIIVLLLFIFIVFNACLSRPSSPSQEVLKSTAQTWIELNSPTYKYDGQDLQFQKIIFNKKDKTKVSLVFTFISRHGGYGNREGMVLTQSLTPHTIVVEVQAGQIKLVITDEEYDEIKQKRLEPGQGLYEIR